MSRVRTGWTPNDWKDIGPATPHRTVGRHDARQAATVGSMLPVMRYGTYLENRTRTKAQNPFSLHYENRKP